VALAWKPLAVARGEDPPALCQISQLRHPVLLTSKRSPPNMS
jgi:hypothetical protein